MVSVILSLVIMLAFPAIGQAATYYTATTGNNSNSCSAAQTESTPKLTIAAGVACLAGGDTLIIKPGTYTNQGILNPPGGSASAYTIISGDPALARPVIRADYTATQRGIYCSRGETCSYMEFRHLEITNAHQGLRMDGTDTNGYSHHIRFINNYVHDNAGTAFQIASSASGFLGGDNLIEGNEFAYNGILNPGYGPGVNNIYNPGNRTVIQNNYFHNLTHGIGIWPGSSPLQNIIIRNNLFHQIGRSNTDTWQQGVTGSKVIHVSTGGGGHEIYNNVIRDSCDLSTCDGILISPRSAQTATQTIKVYNNTIYNHISGSANSIRYAREFSPGSLLVRNNIVYLAKAVVTGGFANGTFSNTQTANPSFTSAGTGDLSLASGSTAINAGTSATGLAFCDTAPEIGALEVPKVLSAVMTGGHFIDVTICTNEPPIRLGTWTPGCTGTGCGTPVTASTSLIGGGIVRVDVGGITGGNCAAGQTWTVSSGSGNTDSALIGNTLNQPLHTTPNFPVDSSACDGGGPTPPPTGDTALYEWEDDCNDSSGNANHATCSGTSFVTGKFVKGLQTNQNEADYADTGLLSGHNPSTNHLVVATWIYIDPTAMGDTADIFGTAIGTDQRFFVFRDSANTWRMGAGATSGPATEFSVSSGWTHVCVKGNPSTDVMTLYINGQAGTVAGASVISYSSYTFASTLRFGLPSGFASTLSGNHIFDRSSVYTTDASCADLFEADQPPTSSPTVTQVAHQWEHTHYLNGIAQTVGAQSAAIMSASPGGAALVVQYNNESGGSTVIQPRFRYNVNGGEFINPVPDTATADGVAYWGEDTHPHFNDGMAGSGALTGALTHTNGITLTNSLGIPTVEMADNNSRTIRGAFRFAAAAAGKTICFKLYDQGGQPLASYTPSGGACVTVGGMQAGIQ
ncbi:MAG: hypothetical protein OEY86_00880 [Nitrospira sp.]|nr:hypothetical protein [Nitrospira sp.]